MSEDEFNKRLAAAKQDEQPDVDWSLISMMVQMDADDAAYRNSLTYQQRFTAAEQQSAAMQQMQIARDYGEQCADTDGLAAHKQVVAQRAKEALAQRGSVPAGYAASLAQRGGLAEALGGFGQYLSKDLQGAYASELQRLDAPPQPRDGLAPDSPLWLIDKLYARIDKLTVRAEQAERNAEVAIRDRDKALAELEQRMAIPPNALKHGGVR